MLILTLVSLRRYLTELQMSQRNHTGQLVVPRPPTEASSELAFVPSTQLLDFDSASTAAKAMEAHPAQSLFNERPPSRWSLDDGLQKHVSKGGLRDSLATIPPNVHYSSLLETQEDVSVLVADDSPSTRKFMKTVLEKQGYHVKQVNNGKEALHEMKASSFDCVFLDLEMPVLDGFDCIASFREWEKCTDRRKRQAICALTSATDEDAKARIAKVGGDFFESKPARIVGLIRITNLCMRLQRTVVDLGTISPSTETERNICEEEAVGSSASKRSRYRDCDPLLDTNCLDPSASPVSAGNDAYELFYVPTVSLKLHQKKKRKMRPILFYNK